MREQAILLNLSGKGPSIYERRGLVSFGVQSGADGWAPAPTAATPAQAPPVRLPRGRSAPMRASATTMPPAAVSIIEQLVVRWRRRVHGLDSGSGV
jgi:hypothetical protein